MLKFSGFADLTSGRVESCSAAGERLTQQRLSPQALNDAHITQLW